MCTVETRNVEMVDDRNGQGQGDVVKPVTICMETTATNLQAFELTATATPFHVIGRNERK